MINFERLRTHKLNTEPYRWAHIKDLYAPDDARQLAATYPRDHFKRVAAMGGEKNYDYEARNLVAMNAFEASHASALSPAWLALANDLVSPEYRSAMSTLTGLDLSHAWIEANVFHFGRGGELGAHRDLPEKLVTNVLYFNETWNPADGGCLGILRSSDPSDMAAEIPPLVGHASLLVRSDSSWHVVSKVVDTCKESRRSVTVTFYPPGSASSMWPVGDNAPLHDYAGS